MRSPCCLYVCVSPHHQQLLNARTSLYETWYLYHGTWAHLNGILHKSLLLVIPLLHPPKFLRENINVEFLHQSSCNLVCLEKNMSKDNVIIVCADFNDISKNSAKEGISSIINLAKKTSHTNIIVMEALHRHDLADWSCVNKETLQFNRLLTKRLKLHNTWQSAR